ncbi:MAG: hypothetical protein GY699_21195 [Desulfobacteraceae bacterium]|nr:hypothetical protein [Desulfobacteraceae bacterium]
MSQPTKIVAGPVIATPFGNPSGMEMMTLMVMGIFSPVDDGWYSDFWKF